MARALCWSPNGRHLAVGFVRGYFGVYDAVTLERLAWHKRTSQDIDVVKYSPDGRQVIKTKKKKKKKKKPFLTTWDAGVTGGVCFLVI